MVPLVCLLQQALLDINMRLGQVPSRSVLSTKPDYSHKLVMPSHKHALSGEHRRPASKALRTAEGAGVGKLQRMAESTADVLGLDWSTDMAEARAVLGPDRVLQGNMDPAVLFASEVRTLPPTHLCSRLLAFRVKSSRQLSCSYLCTCTKALLWEHKGPLRVKSTCPEFSS